jgi:uroporphyrinogen decarboxylase
MTSDLRNSRFLRACRRERVDCTPVWLMRQAGRYMPEYRSLREKYSLLTLARTPELAAQVTLQPIQRFQFDAAIIFADILLPLEPMGLQFEFAKGEGPVIHNPISTAADVEAVRVFAASDELHFVSKAIQLVVKELNGKTPLIGFAGAPFTLASYIIEGGYSRHFLKTRKFMVTNPDAWNSLMQKIARITTSYLQMQVEAGASAVQLFDSWVGVLSPEDYRRYVLPYSREILQNITVPTIHFSTGTSGYLDFIAEAGGDVISVDWRIPLDRAWSFFPQRGIQGNLDPASLFSPWTMLREDIRNILHLAGGKPGHIFNLGHGVLPETPIESVEKLVEEIHRFML